MLERIERNEKRLDSIKASLKETKKALQEFKKRRKDIVQLQKYYGSKTWFKDKETYEKNIIPKIKAGVLSEDEVWNTLEDIDDLLLEMKKIVKTYKK